MASIQRHSGVHGQDHGRVKGCRVPEDSAKTSVRVIPRICKPLDGLEFVYGVITLLSEEKYDKIISAPNRELKAKNLRPLWSKLRAVWSDISNALGGFKDHSLHFLELDEVLGLELSNYSSK